MRSFALLLVLTVTAALFGQRPLIETYSGKTLDEWVEKLAGRAAPVGADPEPPLDRKALEAVSLAWASTTGGGVRNLRSPGKVQWPKALQEVETKKSRERWAEMVQRAAKEARKGRVSAKALSALTAAHKQLLADLERQIDEVPISEFIEARRFLNQLRDDIALLKDARIRELLTLADDLVARRRTVSELVKLFRAKKLRFARCAPGDEARYVALEKAFADFAARATPKR